MQAKAMNDHGMRPGGLERQEAIGGGSSRAGLLRLFLFAVSACYLVAALLSLGSEALFRGQLAERGTRAPAVVLALHRDLGPDLGDGFGISFRFAAGPSGTERVVRYLPVPRSFYKSLKPGERMAVLHLPDDPGRALPLAIFASHPWFGYRRGLLLLFCTAVCAAFARRLTALSRPGQGQASQARFRSPAR